MKRAKKALALASAFAVAVLSAPNMGVWAADRNDEFMKGNYTCTLWNYEDIGTADWTAFDDGTFACSWDGIRNVMFRTGYKNTENPPAWKSLSGLQVDYECTGLDVQGNTYLCVYGTLANPTAEYYIIEDYTTWRPPTGGSDGSGSPYQKLGTIALDGGYYDIYAGKLSQTGFDMHETRIMQYWSVRVHNNRRQMGTVDVAAHFNAWESFGLEVGNLNEVSLCVEGYQSVGEAKISKNNIHTACGGGDFETLQTSSATEPTEQPVDYIAPTGKKNTVYDRFEDTMTSWEGNGTDAFGFAAGFTHGGTQALYVTGRTAAWHGLSASSDELIAGHSYDFDGYAAVNSKAVGEAGFLLGLKYTKDGETFRDTLAEASAKSGKWAKLSTSFEIPSGASEISLFVQTSGDGTETVPFYLDDVLLVDWNEPVPTATGTTTSTTATTYGTIESEHSHSVTTVTAPVHPVTAPTYTTVTDGNPLIAYQSGTIRLEPGQDTIVQFYYRMFGTPTVTAAVSQNPEYATATWDGDTVTVYAHAIGNTMIEVYDGRHSPWVIKVEVVEHVEQPHSKGIRGDVDCSGEVELRDAIMLAKASAGIDVEMTAEGAANADLNNTGGLDNGDLRLLLRYLAGISDKL